MPADRETAVHDLPALRDREHVFRDRAQAGEVLAEMLSDFRGSDAFVFGIPAGGVPVAAEIAKRLGLELDVAVVSKILLPWTSEAGYGAVAFDGSVWIDRRAAARFGLTDEEVLEGTDQARSKVLRRIQRLRGTSPMSIAGRDAIVVDDGIAAGSTVRAAIAALRRQAAGRLFVAVPTGPGRSVRDIAEDVDAVYCANIRNGLSFAVADAYQAWRDVTDEEVEESLRSCRTLRPDASA